MYNILISLAYFSLLLSPSGSFPPFTDFSFLMINHSLTYAYTHIMHTKIHTHTHEQCEYCRLHSGCFVNGGIKLNQCMDVCNSYFTAPKKFTNMSTSNIDFAELRTSYLLHSFGQVFYSQFTGKSQLSL